MIPPVAIDTPIPPPRTRSVYSFPAAVILAVAIFMVGWYTAAQSGVGQTPSANGVAALSSATIEQRIEADGVEIVYTDDPELNCAAAESDEGQTGQGGCVYMGTTPERMYISTGLGESALTYVLIHEYAHILQARGKWPVGGASATGMGTVDSECWADVFSLSEGVPYDQLYYIKSCVFPGGLSLPPSP